MSEIYVIAGAPCTGKTTVINELIDLGYSTLDECTVEARKLASKNEADEEGKFDRILFELRKKLLENSKNEEGIIFSDRGIGDSVAYYVSKGLDVPQDILDYAGNKLYKGIFILEPLGFYEQNEFRQISGEKQEEIQKFIIDSYEKMGYEPVVVPFASVDERIRFILSKINN